MTVSFNHIQLWQLYCLPAVIQHSAGYSCYTLEMYGRIFSLEKVSFLFIWWPLGHALVGSMELVGNLQASTFRMLVMIGLAAMQELQMKRRLCGSQSHA